MTRFLTAVLCLVIGQPLVHGQEGRSGDRDRPAAISAPDATQAAATSDASAAYRIGVNDVVSVSVLHAPELTVTARVTEKGDISLPLLGPVSAAGLTAGELEAVLEERLREKYIREPDATVQITELQSQAVSVVGAVKHPGIFQVRGTKTLLEVLSLAEGVAENAGDSVIVLRKGSNPVNGVSFEVPLKKLLTTPDAAVNVPIYPGDVVNVQAADVVYVIGEVKRPGAFAMRGNDRLTVLRALALGEGLLPTAAKGHALVLRTAEGGERVEIEVDLGDVLKGKQQDFALQAQDVLFVPSSGSKAVVRAAIDTLTRIVTFRGVLGP
jgi:polysaccharide biosynthesis/export protein